MAEQAPSAISELEVARFRSDAYAWLTGPIRTAVDYQPQLASTTVDFALLPPASADGYAGLLGLRTRPRGLTRVDLRRVDGALRSSRFGIGLADLLTALDGPLADTASARAAVRVAARQVWEQAAAHPVIARYPVLAEWLVEERRAGRLPAEPARRTEVLAVALGVAALLPADGIGLARLGWRVCHDTKALTRSGHERSATLRAIAAIRSRPVPLGTEDERALWADVGVRVDPVSSQVLVAGLRPTGNDVVADALRGHAERRLAARLTLAQVDILVAGPAPDGRVFVVENPEAHTTLGAHILPGTALVSTEGWPHLAALRLLRWLAEAGAVVHHHSDFDWDGVAITNLLAAEGFSPWRMGEGDYRTAVAAASEHPYALPTLTGEPTTAVWDSALSLAMAELAVEVHEEDDAVIERLSADLG